MVRRTIHQRQELKPAMRQAHGRGVKVYDLGKIVIKREAERPGLRRGQHFATCAMPEARPHGQS
jgi:hypothetical protein